MNEKTIVRIQQEYFLNGKLQNGNGLIDELIDFSLTFCGDDVILLLQIGLFQYGVVYRNHNKTWTIRTLKWSNRKETAVSETLTGDWRFTEDAIFSL